MAAEGLSQLWLTYTHALLLSGRQWRRLANATTDAHGVSEAKALPLVLIGRLGGEPRQNALAEAVGIEGPSLVRLLDQLEAAGLVTRKEDTTDRRAKVLSLTDTGRSVVARIEADLDRLRKAVFSKVSASDLEASLRVFRAIQDRVGGPSETGISGDRIAHGEAAE
ncbi:transcriptional regulator, MarR family [Methylorubrum populi BJ001]|jgi:MarR family transcriptional regulator for hemolysin|uniref:Transcriptional regulator, MarR family n=1 Tax=Methylorubrum populi (strain ATCC BAA-705 / NCIMB 13946 / BJ001) TaxID=441620 RepID=B1ZH22_METPB|nr:MarR family transcriptional regulator [Methylorubrum populi]ACB78427.1 transcriptional regulator, MarR family [Methylorubrum populi BJ001]